MLFELFSWIKNGQKSISFRNGAITRLIIENELDQAGLRRKTLLRNFHAERQSQTGADLSPLLNDQDAYLRFLSFCLSQLEEHDSANLYSLGIKYLLAGSTTDDQSPYNLTKKNCQVLTLKLHEQKNALALAPLLKVYIDDPEQFAAAILWLLRRGVTSEQLLETQLLQQFMSYNYLSLDSQSSPIHQLYIILNQFPEAHDLLHEAKRVGHGGRGFEEHAITGDLSSQGLRSVRENLLGRDFSPSAENFVALHELFAENFLIQAIEWQTLNHDAIWQVALKDHLNRQGAALKELAAVINQIAVYNDDNHLGTLVSLIDEATVDQLIEQRSGAVLYLLPYFNSICTKINEGDLANYLRQIEANYSSAFDLVPELLRIATVFKHQRKNLANIVFEVILDLVPAHSEFLEDKLLLKQIRQYSENQAIIAKKSAELEAQFDRCVQEQLVAKTFDLHGYHSLEDTWRSVERHLFLLNQISPINYHCPRDKYQLIRLIAKVHYSQHPTDFNIENFILSLGLRAEFLADGVYERVLIEILSEVDDACIRKAIVDQLETNANTHPNWMNKEYGGVRLFERAIRQGNIGLMQWLSPKIEFNFKDLVKMAAETKQWSAVNYLCSLRYAKARSNQPILNEILSLAVAQGELTTVQFLCKSVINPLKSRQIIQAIYAAAKTDQVSVLQYLLSLNQKGVNDEVLAKALREAFHNNSQAVLEHIANLPEHPLLAEAIQRALLDAKDYNLQSVQLLCNLTINRPSQEGIEQAFENAVQLGYLTIVQYLAGVLVKAQRQVTIDQAMLSSVKLGHLAIFKHLVGLVDKAVLQESLQIAAREGQLAIVKTCFELYRPSTGEISSALSKTSTKRCKEVVNYLKSQMPKPSMKDSKKLKLSNIIQLDEGDLPLIETLVLTPPSPCTPKSPYCSATNRVSFFNESVRRLLDSPSPIEAVKTPPPAQEVTSPMHKSASCGSLSTLSLFSTANKRIARHDLSGRTSPRVLSPIT